MGRGVVSWIVTAYQRPRYASRALNGLKDSPTALSHVATACYPIVLAALGYLLRLATRPPLGSRYVLNISIRCGTSFGSGKAPLVWIERPPGNAGARLVQDGPRDSS
jgi:hypothetical protein